MKARMKRLLILIMVCTLIFNYDIVSSFMGIDALFVNAASAEAVTEEVILETEEVVSEVVSEGAIEGEDTTQSEGTAESEDATQSEGTAESEDTTQGGNDIEGDVTQSGNDVEGDATQSGNDVEGDATQSGNDVESDATQSGNDVEGDATQSGNDVEDTTLSGNEFVVSNFTLEDIISILEGMPEGTTIAEQLAALGVDTKGIIPEELTIAELLSLLRIEVTELDMSGIDMQAVWSREYTLLELLTLVYNRLNGQINDMATSILPTTLAELEASGSTTFTLSNYQDLINLQKLSRVTSLEGYTFTFLRNSDEVDQKIWNISKATWSENGSATEYRGIGCEEFPFKGTLETYLSGMIYNISKPMCNYLSTGAVIRGFNFNATGACAAVAEYVVTEEGSATTTVTLEKIVVGGTVGGAATSAVGGLFAHIENKTTSPIDIELADNSGADAYSVKISAAVIGVYAGGIVGVVNAEDGSTGPVNITSKLTVVSGTVTGGNTGATGGIVGKLGKGGVLTMDTASFGATIAGKGNNGGAVGLVDGASFVATTPMTLKVTVKSNNNMSSGGLIGKAVSPKQMQVENVTLDGSYVEATNLATVSSCAGGVVGVYTSVDTDPEIIIQNIIIKNTTITGYDKGGIIGNLNGSHVTINAVTVEGTGRIGTSNDGLAGGLIGRLVGQDIELKNSTIQSSNIQAIVSGGLVAGIEANDAYNQVRVTNAIVTATMNGNIGGIAGRVLKGSLLNLCGEIKIQAPRVTGYIVGEQSQSLIYFEDSTVREYFETNKTQVANVYDNVGTYGGVIENTNGLIDYDAQLGQNVTGTVASGYQLSNKEDFIRLTIALNTDCVFGANCFGVSADVSGAKALRQASYTVTNSVNLANTGIYDLSRNDKYTEGDADTYAFQGTFEGSNNDIAITLDSHDTNQSHIGLFPIVKNATFKNLTVTTIEGKPWAYAKTAGGIAAFGYGNLTLDNVTTEVELKARQEIVQYYYGGIVGSLKLNSTLGNQLTTNNVKLLGSIENVRVLQYAGGLAGYVNAGTGTGDAVTRINFNGETVVGNTLTVIGDHRVNGAPYASRTGGLIGEIVTANMTNQTYAKIQAENIHISGQVMDYTSATYIVESDHIGSGGMLGHYWDNVEADFTQITVDGATSFKSNTRFGGLFARVSGKLYLHDVDILAGTINGKNSVAGMLVGDGRRMVMLLDEYDIADAVSLTCATSFDEIVGWNIGSDGQWGGIVSIKNPDFKTLTSPGYVNQKAPVSNVNGNTRYYYNLFEQSPGEYTQNMLVGDVIDTEAKLMVWSTNHFVADELKRFIQYYYDDTSNFAEGTNKTFENELDMTGYSMYPSYVRAGTYSGNNAKIIFAGNELEAVEKNNRPASAWNKQHYRMHAGLFYLMSGVTLIDMTFSGSVTNLATNTGAIGCGGGVGTVWLSDITLDGLTVTNYTDAHQVGLLLSIVGDYNRVVMDGIKMINYSTYGKTAGKYAASALIGTVGNDNARSIEIRFLDMQIPYVVQNATHAPVTTEAALRYASFIDAYNYINDSDLYKGKGLYLFNKWEYTTNPSQVTLGQEIMYGLEYNDVNEQLPSAVITEAGTGAYLPYVCSSHSKTTILVNPKRGDITEGCGTYEDPYILNNAKQIYSLYQYLSGNTQNMSYLNGWQVNEFEVHNGGTHNVMTFDEYNTGNGFPTRDNLRQAYYKVTADIDLTTATDMNEYVISNEFDGIGSNTYPFAGVITGDVANKPKITLPGNDKGKTKANFGLIQYMKGAVVQNLHITTKADTIDSQKDDIYVVSYAGGVAAKIIGGDNIIDNVTVSTRLKKATTASSTVMGGYVGLLEKGGLIVRNLETEDLVNFVPLLADGTSYTQDMVSAVVGKVEDGYLLYEGNVGVGVNTTSKVVTAADFGFAADALELSKTFPMVNGGYLDAQTVGNKIQINLSGTDNTITLANDAHLQIIAMALNADALSVRGDKAATNVHYNGYDKDAICRKAAYNAIQTSGSADGTFATQYDNHTYNFPYLIYKYFEMGSGSDITTTYADLYITNTAGNYVSKLNKVQDARDYTTTYVLQSGTYDMVDYAYAFRGIGALYDTTYSRFHANFNGNDNTIKAEMTAGYDRAIWTTALFNDLNTSAFCLNSTDANAETFTISNAVVEGSYTNNTYSNDATSRRVGAIAGMVYGNWTFSNITIQGATVISNGIAGGLVGKISHDTNGDRTFAYTFTGCKLMKKNEAGVETQTTVQANACSAAGLVGIVGSAVQNVYWNGTITCNDTVADGLSVSADCGAAGGLFGYIGNAKKSDVIIDGDTIDAGTKLENMTIISNATAAVTAGASAGGVIGEYYTVLDVSTNPLPINDGQTLSISNTEVHNSNIAALINNTEYGTGGIVGRIWMKPEGGGINTAKGIYTFAKNHVQDVTLGSYHDGISEAITSSDVGGMIGRVKGEKLIATDCTVKNTTDTPVFTTKGHFLGGLIGYQNVKISEITYADPGDLTAEAAVTGVDAHISNLNLIGQGTTADKGTVVGGVIGTNGDNSYSINYSTQISNAKVEGCLLETVRKLTSINQNEYAVGGVWGTMSGINDSYNGSIENVLDNILVTDTDIVGSSGGGLIGSARAMDAAAYNHKLTNIAVRNNHIYAKASGGLIGTELATGRDNANEYDAIVITDNKIGAYFDSDYVWAGGLIGLINQPGNGAWYSATRYLNAVTISDNYIVAYMANKSNMRAGGMFGEIRQGTNTKYIYVYKPVISNNHIGYWNTNIVGNYTLEGLKNITDAEVALLDQSLGVVDTMPTSMKESDIQKYAINIGNLVGKVNINAATHAYFLRPYISYDDTFTGVRPVVDCGVGTGTGAGTIVDGSTVLADKEYPYSYRSSCHVIYFDAQTASEASSTEVLNKYASSYSPKEDEYLLESIEGIITEYDAASSVLGTDYAKVLDAYRLNQYYNIESSATKMTLMNLYNKAYYDGSGGAAATAKGIPNDLQNMPLIVYDAQNGSAHQVVNGMIQILTNVGGGLDSNIKPVVQVTSKRAVVNNGTITLNSSKAPSLSVAKDGYSIEYNHYDEYIEGSGTTITILEVSYYWKDVRETLYIPVYVLERLDVRTFIRMKEGTVYSCEEMQDSTVGDGTDKHSVIMANDTTYTMMIEYLYGSGRKKFKTEEVQKQLKLEIASVGSSGVSKPKGLAVGTKITLIDVESGFAYYYEATEENQAPIEDENDPTYAIPFTEFKRVPTDASSAAYEYRTMQEVDDINSTELQTNYGALDRNVYDNVGVERFLMIVDGTNAELENVIYNITVETEETTADDCKDIYPGDIIEITAIPGLAIGFEGKTVQTKIVGEMSQDNDVIIDAVYGIKAQKLEGQGEDAEAPYWIMAADHNVIDSANNNKYLELAIYLQDDKGNRITLPQNTNVSMNGQILTASGTQSVFYLYKDTGDTEPLEGIDSDKQFTAQIVFSFDTAILDDYTGQYSVVIELLRTDSPDYPMSGDKPDYYGDNITTRTENDLAVAVFAKDLLTLGINTYQEETHLYEIPFTSMIDFGGVIDFSMSSDAVNTLVTKWSEGTKYQITYRLYKKEITKAGTEYIPIGDDRITLWYKDTTAASGYSKMESVDMDGQTMYRSVREFTKDEIRYGTDGEGLITREMMIKVNTEGMSNKDLSNYKLELSVVPYDAELLLGPDGTEACLQDFFIFTVAKLKTDME